jgi:uncharacterized RDD family membrane protein YckC
VSGQRVILTPEHVLIHLPPAGAGSRFLALIVDAALVFGAAGFAAKLLLPLSPEGVGYALFATLNFVLTWGYHVYFETRHGGRSPGKMLVGLRVVDGRGLPLELEQSFVRNVMRVLDFAPAFYGLGACAIQLDAWRRRLGDIVADTLVVREARSFSLPAASLASRQFNSLREPRVLRLVRRRVSVEEREFLLTLCLRSQGLMPQARFDLFEDVARHYRARLELDDPNLSGENLVRGLASILSSERRAIARSVS